MRASSLKALRVLKPFAPLKVFFVRNRYRLIAGLISLLLVDFLQLLIPLVIKRVIDGLTAGEATSSVLIRYAALIVGIAAAIGVFRFIWRYFLFGHSRKLEEALRNRLYDHLQGLSMSFYDRTRTGDLMARAINDINAVRMASGMGLVALTDGTILGLAAIGFMIYIDPLLALIAVLPAPLLVYFSRILTRRMSTGYDRVQAGFSTLTERTREAFAGIRIVKSYVREPWEHAKVEEAGRRYVDVNLSLARTLGFFFPMMTIFTNLGLAAVIWLGGRLTILGGITTGDFVAFIGYLALLAWPMMAMGWVINLIQRGSASMRRINQVLDETPEIKEPAVPGPLKPIEGRIEFRNLTFRYPGKEEDALQGIDLEIRAGSTVALAGRVGSGKTTLLYTIPRMLDVPEGMLFVDGVDVCRIPLKALRRQIGFVTQESVLFSDTIRNNILFGRTGITESEIEAVLSRADILEEVLSLEHGLDTVLGERGVTLSGGQRQRLTIARALVGDPRILILDDALSMVDTRTEERILNRILETRRHKTSIIVSHRLSTISRADLIAVLDDGRIVERGIHDELIRLGDKYAKIYERQALVREFEINPGTSRG